MKKLVFGIMLVLTIMVSLSACKFGGGSDQPSSDSGAAGDSAAGHVCTPGWTDEWISDYATCNQPGGKTVTTYCSECGGYMSEEYVEIDKLPHTPGYTYEEWIQDVTCYQDGLYYEITECAECYEAYSRVEKTVPQTDDHWIQTREENRIEPTCISEGSCEEVCYCYYCNLEFYRDTVTLNMTDHTPAEAVRENATTTSCTEAGSYELVKYCSNADCKIELERKLITVDKADHTPAEAVRENEVAPGCTTSGSYDEVIYCDICESEIRRTKKTIPAAHQFDSYGICTVCEPNASRGLAYNLFTNYGDPTMYVGIRGVGSCTDNVIVIPSIIDGKAVRSIDDYAFEDCKHIVSITIPHSITYIGTRAFYGCNNLIEVIDRSPLYISAGSYEHGYVAYYAKEVHGGDSKFENIDGYLFYTYGGVNYLVGYSGDSTELTLPESYNEESYEIHPYAFYNYGDIAAITIPDAVTAIGENAFYGCQIKSATIPAKYISTVLSDKLSKLTITSGAIEANAMSEHKSLIKLTIGEGVTSIGEKAFYNCYSLTSVTVESDILSIGDYAFTGCYRLLEVINHSPLLINSGSNSNGYIARYAKDVHTGASRLIEMDDYLFYYYGGASYLVGYVGDATELVLPESYNGKSYEIHSFAFYERSDITGVTLPSNVTAIGQSAFLSCTSLGSIDIPGSVSQIYAYAFQGCSSLSSVSFGNGVVSIDISAFYGCSKLTSITIPESVTSIGGAAFSGCTSLSSVTFTEDVYIGNNAFHSCTSLTSVNISDINNWFDMQFGNEHASPLYYAKNLYANGELVTDLVIPENITVININAFNGCTSLKSVTIHGGVTTVGANAFYGCTALRDVTIHEGVTTIAMGAFYGCTALRGVTIPSSVTTIGANAFYGCTSLKSVTVPDGATVGADAFYRCPIEDATVPASALPYIKNSNLKSVTVTSGTSIGASALSDCKKLVSVVLPDSIESIESYAFYGCSALISITIPHSVESIGTEAFYNCYRLAEVINLSPLNIVAGSTDHGYVAYYAIEVHQGESKIVNTDGYIFYTYNGVNYLLGYIGDDTTLELPESVGGEGYEIHHRAFSERNNITSIVVPSSVTAIGEGAFSGCVMLKSITLPFVGDRIKTASDYYQYPFGYIFGTSSHPESLAAEQYYYGSSLSTLTYTTYYIPKSLRTVTVTGGNILRSAFSDCSSITSLIIDSGVMRVENYAFHDLMLASVTINGDETDFGVDAFTNCFHIVEVINNSSRNINSCGSVAECALEVHTGDSKIVELGDYLFYTYENTNYLVLYTGYETKLLLPESYNGEVYNIHNFAFKDCAMTSVTISDNVRKIGHNAFTDCDSLTSLIIPDGVTISSNSISNCDNLTSITIGEGVSTNSYAASETIFGGCIRLAEIINHSSISISVDSSDWYTYGCSAIEIHQGASKIVNKNNFIFYVCDSGNYLIAYWGNDTNITLPKDFNGEGYRIHDWAFSYNDNITRVVIPDSVTGIGSYAFYNCPSLSYATIGGGVTFIGENAFSGMNSFRSITVENYEGWWYATSADATSGQRMIFKDSYNAALMVTYYDDYYWFRT